MYKLEIKYDDGAATNATAASFGEARRIVFGLSTEQRGIIELRITREK